METKAPKDWFEEGLLKRVPEDIKDSFSQAQIDALK